MKYKTGRSWLWILVEAVIPTLVVVAVGWQFSTILHHSELWHTLRPNVAWLAASVMLYLLGLSASAIYWWWLLKSLDQSPESMFAIMQAYYIGQLGRYVPGKVVGVVWRSRLLHSPGVHGGIAALTVVYETLTTLASGALLAGLVLGFAGLLQSDDSWTWLALFLLGLPIVPCVFNWIVDRVIRSIPNQTSTPPRHIQLSTLAIGLAITAIGWVLQGASLVTLIEAFFPGTVSWTFLELLRYSAYAALAYAGGFIVLVVPGGLGVREFILQRFLVVEFSFIFSSGAMANATAIALLLRLVWTIADVGAAMVCWLAHLIYARRMISPCN